MSRNPPAGKATRACKGAYWIGFLLIGLIGTHYLHWEPTRTLSYALWRLSPAIASEEHLHDRSMEIRRHLGIPDHYEIEIRIVDSIESVYGIQAAGQVYPVSLHRYVIKMVRMSDRLLVHELCHIALGHLWVSPGSSEFGGQLRRSIIHEPEAIQ